MTRPHPAGVEHALADRSSPARAWSMPPSAAGSGSNTVDRRRAPRPVHEPAWHGRRRPRRPRARGSRRHRRPAAAPPRPARRPSRRRFRRRARSRKQRRPISAPRNGAVEMRQRSPPPAGPSAANGVTSRIARHSDRERRSRSNLSIAAWRAPRALPGRRLRCATEGATPSSRNTVTAPAGRRGFADARRDRCRQMRGRRDIGERTHRRRHRLAAAASSRPNTSSVASVSARGSVLIVTSVMTASVPQEPARSLQRS